MEINKKYQLRKDQYLQDEFDKKQIVLHHTAGSGDAENIIDWWEQSKARIATCFIIEKDGSIFQVYESDKMWGSHIGVRGSTLKENGVKWKGHAEFLDEYSIGIELVSWGPLTKKGDKYYSYVNSQVSGDSVTKYDKKFRGYEYYESYTCEQINALEWLLKHLGEKHDIPLYYDHMIWDVYKPALDLRPGIYSHTSYRSDKFDCHPQPELIDMLKNLDPMEKMKKINPFNGLHK